MTAVDRRRFLQTSAVATGIFAFGPAFWQDALAAPAKPGPGPYGPPGAPDPVTGIAVPKGFTVREVARGGAPVGTTGYTWHPFSDGSGCFPLPDGGWVLAVNSEVPGLPQGGASSITFDRDGRITGARRILSGTTMNCAGGVTPWGTWLSGEETGSGQVWECDPLGEQPAVARPAMGRFTHEAVCVDEANRQLYLTEDTANGCFYRFTPDRYPDLSAGRLDVMLVDAAGRVSWRPIADPSGATPTRLQVPEAARFQRGEGTWFDQGVVYFVTTTQARLFALHVREQVLELVYDGSALGLQAELTGIDNVTVHPRSGDVFVAEDENTDATLDLGIITPEREVARFLTASGPQHEGSELTGPSFDPSGTRLYISSQRAGGLGAVYEITGPFRQTRPEGVGGLPATSMTPPRDRRAPRVSVRVLGTGTVRGLRRAGLPVAVRADEAGTVEVVVRERLSRGRRGRVLARSRRRRVAAGKDLRLRLRPTAEVARRLRARRTLAIEVEVRATDAAGNARRVRRALRLR
jgi:uncharacterized protein